MGYILYRTHVRWMDDVAGNLDSNNGAFGSLMTLLKLEGYIGPEASVVTRKSPGSGNSGQPSVKSVI
jgi:hypothetical protein